jgi:hypothetical protein
MGSNKKYCVFEIFISTNVFIRCGEHKIRYEYHNDGRMLGLNGCEEQKLNLLSCFDLHIERNLVALTRSIHLCDFFFHMLLSTKWNSQSGLLSSCLSQQSVRAPGLFGLHLFCYSFECHSAHRVLESSTLRMKILFVSCEHMYFKVEDSKLAHPMH